MRGLLRISHRAAIVVGAAGAIAACGFDGVASLSGGGEPGTPGEGGSIEGGAATDASMLDDGSSVVPIGDANITPDAAALTHPASCAELPAAENTDVTLYVAHDQTKPWNAHCGSGGATYLPLPAGVATNYSSYPASGCADVPGGSAGSARTTWTRVRIDPVSLIVQTNDYAGATSTGKTHEVSGNGAVNFTYDKMPFATGRTCDTTQTAAAKFDLTGTKFRVLDNTQFILEGFQSAGGSATNGSVTTLLVGGFPAGVHACRPANTDYYQRNGGKCLQLQYAP